MPDDPIFGLRPRPEDKGSPYPDSAIEKEIEGYINIIYANPVIDTVTLPEFEGFEWDAGNIEKNRLAHQVTPQEAEQVFFNRPLIVADDVRHSRSEKPYLVLGQTDEDRPLFIAFTLRKRRLRVISARDMNGRERKVYQS